MYTLYMLRNHAYDVSERLMLYYVHAETFLLQKRQRPELQATETITEVEKGGYPRART